MAAEWSNTGQRRKQSRNGQPRLRIVTMNKSKVKSMLSIHSGAQSAQNKSMNLSSANQSIVIGTKSKIFDQEQDNQAVYQNKLQFLNT